MYILTLEHYLEYEGLHEYKLISLVKSEYHVNETIYDIQNNIQKFFKQVNIDPALDSLVTINVWKMEQETIGATFVKEVTLYGGK